MKDLNNTFTVLKTQKFGYVKLIETNVKNHNTGMFYKFVKVLNNDGADVSQEFAEYIGNYPTTKRKKFYGQLMNSGYGFKATDYIIDYFNDGANLDIISKEYEALQEYKETLINKVK